MFLQITSQFVCYCQVGNINARIFSLSDSAITIVKFNLYRNYLRSDANNYEMHYLYVAQNEGDSIKALVTSGITNKKGILSIQNLIPGNFDLELYNDDEYKILRNIKVEASDTLNLNIYVNERETTTNSD